jgi:hypothetical protein
MENCGEKMMKHIVFTLYICCMMLGVVLSALGLYIIIAQNVHIHNFGDTYLTTSLIFIIYGAFMVSLPIQLAGIYWCTKKLCPKVIQSNGYEVIV